jgi:hypothetical protein
MKNIETIIEENNLPNIKVGQVINLYNDLWDGNGEFPIVAGSYSFKVGQQEWVNYEFESWTTNYPCGQDSDMQLSCMYCYQADGHGCCQVAGWPPNKEIEVRITAIELI